MRYKSQENAVFIAIHPTTYRSGGFLAHGVLNVKFLDQFIHKTILQLLKENFLQHLIILR